MFEDSSITNIWLYPDFRIYGIIYDETDNIFYLIEYKKDLDTNGLSKVEEILEMFRGFLQGEISHLFQIVLLKGRR